MKNLALMTVLIRYNDDTWYWLTFLGHPVVITIPNQYYNSWILEFFCPFSRNPWFFLECFAVNITFCWNSMHYIHSPRCRL